MSKKRVNLRSGRPVNKYGAPQKRQYPMVSPSFNKPPKQSFEALYQVQIDIFDKIKKCVYLALNGSPLTNEVSAWMFEEMVEYHKKENSLQEYNRELSENLFRLRTKGPSGDLGFSGFAVQILKEIKAGRQRT